MGPRATHYRLHCVLYALCLGLRNGSTYFVSMYPDWKIRLQFSVLTTLCEVKFCVK